MSQSCRFIFRNRSVPQPVVDVSGKSNAPVQVMVRRLTPRTGIGGLGNPDDDMTVHATVSDGVEDTVAPAAGLATHASTPTKHRRKRGSVVLRLVRFLLFVARCIVMILFIAMGTLFGWAAWEAHTHKPEPNVPSAFQEEWEHPHPSYRHSWER